MIGYKVVDKNITFEIGETYYSKSGFSFYKNAIDCFNCCKFNSQNKVFKIDIINEIKEDQDKFFTDKFNVIRELTWHEVLDLVMENDYINGEYNYDSNIGRYNLGTYNVGYKNIGDCNIGNFNMGYDNLGNFNSGCNNIGEYNIGDNNIGAYNTGFGNLSCFNTGDFNIGYYNTGIFNTTDTHLRMFNKDTNLTYGEWLNSDVRKILINNFNLTDWIEIENMTDEEKKEHKEYEILGGYLKVYTYKQAWQNLWDKITQEEKEKIMSLPNFDKDIFHDITGIEIK